jgi:putative ABC transport system permease protein
VVTVPFAIEMFGSSDEAIGREFQILGIPFRIIGTFKESVDTFGQSEITDNTVLIPYSVARYFTGSDRVKTLYFSIRSMNEVVDATSEIKRVISSRHKPNSVYKAQNLKELLTTAATIANALTAVLVLVAAVTLAVGGVGIMNIMLATVRSRIREIQFLAEAVIISLAGGVVGVIVGLMVPLSIRLFANVALPISAMSVLIALVAATAVGVIFGTVPATRAAQLDPVESLKYE